MEAFFRSARQPSRPSEWTLEEAARFAALKEGYLLQFLSTHKKAFATARRLGLPLLQSQPLPPSVAEGGQQRRRVPSSAPAGGPPAVRRAKASSAQCGSTRPASRPPRQPPAAASAPATSAASAVAAGNADRASASCSVDAASVRPLNARQHRSAARSARRHAKRQRATRSFTIAILFAIRLRRRARQQREQDDLDDLREEIGPAGLDPNIHSPAEIAFVLRETDVVPPNWVSQLGQQRALDQLAKRERASSGSSSSASGRSSSSGGVGVAVDHGLAVACCSSTRRAPKRGGGSRWGPAVLR